MSDVSVIDDLSEFRSSFYEECAEMLLAIDDRLACAQSRIPDIADLNDVFRAVHTIKGLAGFFNLDGVSTFAHGFETLLVALREARLEYTPEIGALLVDGADALAKIIEDSRKEDRPPCSHAASIITRIEATLNRSHDPKAVPLETEGVQPPDTPDANLFEIRFRILGPAEQRPKMRDLVIEELRRLGEVDLMSCEFDPEEAASSGSQELSANVVRITTDRTEQVIRDAFAFVDHDVSVTVVNASSDIAGSSPAAALRHAISGSDDSEPPPRPETKGAKPPTAVSTIRVDLGRVDRLVNMVGELVISQAMLAQQIADQTGSTRQTLRQSHEELANHMRELQECVMAIRMQPVRSVFSRMPRLVREISAKLGKKVRLDMTGEQTEIDKTVIEELGDPLLHMIRNAIDHGIESAEKRRAAGKPEVGTIELSASQRGGNILISLSDDGAGIDRQRVRQKAIEREIISPDAQLTGEELDQLIFAPGFSTASEVTDVSGRGVGMDVVVNKIKNIGGRIHIQSSLGRGTKFTLVLPLTLAVLDGMLVSVAAETYILPLTSIVETIRPDRKSVRQLANGSSVVALRGEFIRLVSLGDVFGLCGAVVEPWKALVVVVELDNGGKLGLVVDELIGQRQVVVKSLTANFDHVEGISGATILGTGRVALILDIEQLAKIGARQSPSFEWAHTSAELSQIETESTPPSSPELEFSTSA